MSYLLNLIWGAPVEICYIYNNSNEIKKTNQYEYKNITNKEMVTRFNFSNLSFDFDFDAELFSNIEYLFFESVIFKSITSYNFLLKCKNLKSLYLNKCNIKYLSSIINSSQINLDSLTFIDCEKIDDFDISLLNNLKELTINGCNLTKIGNLNKLLNLVELNLNNNSILNLDGIEKLINLKNLNLDKNIITNLDVISSLINLEKVNISNNPISKLWNLKLTTNIKSLICNNTDLLNIDDILELKNLEHLEIKKNKIIKLPNILQLINLNYNLLCVDWTYISYIDGMKGFGLIKNILLNK